MDGGLFAALVGLLPGRSVLGSITYMYTHTHELHQEAGAVPRLTLDYQPTYQRFRAKVCVIVSVIV